MKRAYWLLTVTLLVAGLFLVACGGAAAPEAEQPAATEAVVEPTEVPPTEAPPTEVPPTEVPPTEVPPTEVPPTEAPTEVPTPAWEAPEGALVAVPVAEAPTLDGIADEDFWANAPSLVVEVEEGVNTEENEVTIKSVYDEDNVYFVATWADPTLSNIRSPWVKQEDGTWALLKDPNDKGGDNNLYYEDKLAFIWPIDSSMPGFEERGCGVACHEGEDPEAKPYGNKYTKEEGQLGDIWHWKSVRNLNQIDDQYLDWTRYSEDTKEAGRHSDPNDGGGYVNNETEDKTLPAFMGPEGYPTDGTPGYILDEEKLPFDDSLFVVGDYIPAIIKSVIEGDRGDIAAAWNYADGVWTLEFGRALETGSEYDVQFNDLTVPYYFGVAVFDNAQVRHAYQDGASMLVFQPMQ